MPAFGTVEGMRGRGVLLAREGWLGGGVELAVGERLS
jgi:hypothetical protein